MISVRNLTQDEVRGFGYEELNAVNWGVILNGEPVAYFSAEPIGDDILEVHVTAKRRKLHPKLLRVHAEQMSNRLLELGAKGLVAKIAPDNRASIAVAMAAGFDEESRDDNFVVMVKK